MEPIAPEQFSRARAFSSATLHEAAGQIGALPSRLRPLASDFRLCGPAFTVLCPPRNNLWIHRALASAKEGDVLVVAIEEEAELDAEAGYWGEVMTVAAMSRRLEGLVIDGTVRDAREIRELGFPVFTRGLSIRGTGKDPEAPGALGVPVTLGEVVVSPGDLLLGDGDGLVVLPPDRIEETLTAARDRETKEAEVMERLRRGETTLDIYGWSS